MQQELVLKFKNGDRDSFNEICRVMYPALISYAKLFLNSCWAEDVVQDVLFGLWKQKKNIRVEDGVEGYLLRSVYNRSLYYIKRKGHYDNYASSYRQQINELMISYYSPDNNPVIEALFKAENRAIVSQAIENLPPKCREVFKLSFYSNLSNKEISEKLGIALSTVENHKYLAMKELRLQLGGIKK